MTVHRLLSSTQTYYLHHQSHPHPDNVTGVGRECRGDACADLVRAEWHTWDFGGAWLDGVVKYIREQNAAQEVASPFGVTTASTLPQQVDERQDIYRPS